MYLLPTTLFSHETTHNFLLMFVMPPIDQESPNLAGTHIKQQHVFVCVSLFLGISENDWNNRPVNWATSTYHAF